MVNALMNKALQLHRQGRLDEADRIYEEVLRIDAANHQALHYSGVVAIQKSQYQRAVELIRRSIALHPDDPDAYGNLGVALLNLDRMDEALSSLDRAIGNKPDYAEACFNRGLVFLAQHRYEEALENYRRAVSIRPDYAEVLSNQASLLHALGRHGEAVEAYRQVLAVKPDDAVTYNDLGVVLQEMNRADEAFASYDRAIELQPGNPVIYWNKSVGKLLFGEYEEGWVLNEWRWKVVDALKLEHHSYVQPRWTGREPLRDKTILLYSEQGLGDTIQFARYIQMVAYLGARIILGVDPSLVTLLGQIHGITSLVSKGQKLPRFDYHCPLMSLPRLFRTTVDSIPFSTKYLSSDPERVDRWRRRLGTKSSPRIGLAWSGNPELNKDANRSIELARLIKSLPDGFDYYSLQKDLRAHDRATLRQGGMIRHLGDELQDFSDTAALCDLMDLVISVDTALVHLAGALGRPVWLLNRFDTCWRWLTDREDSPWYASMKIYRQQKPGDWDAVLQRVAGDLEERFGRAGRRQRPSSVNLSGGEV